MILLCALFASLAVLPPSRGQTQLEDARIMPTPEEIKSVFEGVEAAGWSDKEGYNSKFSYNTNANKDREYGLRSWPSLVQNDCSRSINEEYQFEIVISLRSSIDN